MKIIVTDTGKLEKQKIYMDWIHTSFPDAELSTASYKNNFSNLSGFDGLVLTGGIDVDPSLSKAEPAELVQEYDRRRDEFEFRMIEQALHNRMPVLGICRGLQVTNVFLGGTLIADLPSAGFSTHTASKGEPEQRHSITINKGSLIHTIAKSTAGEVNSYHHQSVLQTADSLMATGHSNDGVIESMEWKEKTNKSFLMLVQWHPERMNDQENPLTGGIASTFVTEVQKFNSMK